VLPSTASAPTAGVYLKALECDGVTATIRLENGVPTELTGAEYYPTVSPDAVLRMVAIDGTPVATAWVPAGMTVRIRLTTVCELVGLCEVQGTVTVTFGTPPS